MATDQAPIKVTLNLHADDVAIMDALADKHDVTKTHVVRQALALIKYFDDAKAAGSIIIMRDAHNQFYEVAIPMIKEH